MLKTKEDIVKVIKQDTWMIEVLEAAAELHLPDYCISAGFVRSKVWDVQHRFTKRTPLADVDIVYFDADDISKATEKKYEIMLQEIMPSVPWSVKNQARMHLLNNMPAFLNTEHAIACYPETATSIGVRLESDELSLVAPHGVADLLSCRVVPTPLYIEGSSHHSIFVNRIKRKNWPQQWPQVKMEGFNE